MSKRFKEIYSKAELIANGWKYAYLEIAVHSYCSAEKDGIVIKLPYGLSKSQALQQAGHLIKEFFAPAEINPNDYYVVYSHGTSTGGVTESVDLYNLLK